MSYVSSNKNMSVVYILFCSYNWLVHINKIQGKSYFLKCYLNCPSCKSRQLETPSTALTGCTLLRHLKIVLPKAKL